MKKRERDFSEVDCPTHQKTYCLCYVSQTKGETNPDNLVISVLDIGKGCSLP
jgi:hypothetical protein